MKKKYVFALIVSALIVLLCGVALAGTSSLPCPQCGDTSAGWIGLSPIENNRHKNTCLCCFEDIYGSCNPVTAISAKEPTCAEEGHTAQIECNICGQVLQQSETIPTTPHTPGPAATCTTAQTCADCGKVLNMPTPHTPGAKATCTTPQTCNDCGKVLQVPLGHIPGGKATCTTAQTCTRCDYVYEAALGHNPGDKATCTTAQTCTRCDYVYEAALGHNPGDKATCTTAQTCTRCDYVYEAALGHNPGDKATCTTAQTCIRCDYVYEEALGHNENGPEATCTTDKVCVNDGCDAVLEKAIGHDYHMNKTVAPTCTQEGYTVYKCKNCGDSYREDYVDKWMHWFDLWMANGEMKHIANCKRENCEQVGEQACTFWTLTIDESLKEICPVCGRFGESMFAAIPDGTIIGENLPMGEAIVRSMENPFEGALWAFTAAWEYDGRVIPFTGKVSVTLPINGDIGDFKLVRVDVVSAMEDAGRLEVWTDIEFAFEDGKLSFETDAEGLFVLVPVE